MVEMDFVCVECGAPASETYRRLQGSIIKISQCDKCGRTVDKYIEFDASIILLDALLHKHQAYRHMLYNSSLQWYWKLLVVLLFCDTYLQWQHVHPKQNLMDSQDISLLYAALEWDFYTMFLYAAVDWAVLCGTVITTLTLKDRLKQQTETAEHFDWSKSVVQTVTKAMTVSSFGKLLVIPATIWGQSHSAVCLGLTHLFVFTSNAAALQVVVRLSRGAAIAILGSAHIVQFAVQYALKTE